jgi:hypothetical protein
MVQKLVRYPIPEDTWLKSMTRFIIEFFKKYKKKNNWHSDCIIKRKSDTLISFLLKEVCFVPQSGPFSISALPAAFPLLLVMHRC